ncbi:unnamed protein product [Hermetia illucens]|uniref:Pyridoxal kinase n=2 Tax=Hermetia illucens TaxID=343691 RepID=A0A7R8UJU3_HERIL|nr:unnamed protein product [Hermetia illucens]
MLLKLIERAICIMSGDCAVSSRKVLSIQSHVVHGYVGNKSATFPLQVLGFEADAVNSVQFSNHTGYKCVKGQVLQEKELSDLIEGLKANDILQHYTHLLTGYIGSATFLTEIVKTVEKLRQANSQLVYVCDPVLGDGGKLYVPENLVPIYREQIIPLANVVTPNQFEVELLTQTKITNEQDVWSAMEWFHSRNVNIVVVSSTDFGSSDILRAYLSVKEGGKYAMDIPRQGDGTDFTGTGDLFASLLLAHISLQKDPVKAFEYTVSTLQHTIKATLDALPKDVKDGKRKMNVFEKELKLVQCKRFIENPTTTIKAHCISK